MKRKTVEESAKPPPLKRIKHHQEHIKHDQPPNHTNADTTKTHKNQIDDICDEYDMFAQSPGTPPPSSSLSTETSVENTTLNDASSDHSLSSSNSVQLSFDKAGYLQYRIGHVLHSRYKLKELAGTGVFSKVLLAEDLQTTNHHQESDSKPHIVAIKIIRNNESMQRSGYNEIKIMQQLHENDPKGEYHCLQLVDHFEYVGQHVCLVLESYECNLRQYLFQHGPCPMHKLRIYAYSLLKALYLLKHCEMVHADLKPDNIMINKDATRIVLGDFGTAFHISEAGISPLLQSRFYRAPEVILGFKHSYSVDMFSLGCTLFELCTGRILFESQDNNDHLKLIMELKGELPRQMRRHQHTDEGLFAQEYFDERGQFLEHRVDPGDSKRMIVTPHVIPKKHTVFDLLREHCPREYTKGGGEALSKLRVLGDLIERMLVVHPQKRISVDDAFYHEFFQSSRF
mmetsp:Transcript_2466/g.9283  ORF Transcript_2466/g.9283 Transcript_2466/m.9283 type:complete len:456 (+) Transcript_2466:3564-4931(+)